MPHYLCRDAAVGVLLVAVGEMRVMKIKDAAHASCIYNGSGGTSLLAFPNPNYS